MEDNLNEEMDKGVELPKPEENLDAAPGAYSTKPFGGQSLQPAAPKGIRLNSKVLKLGMVAVLLVLMGVVYGIYSRGAKQKHKNASKDGSDKTMLAASAMGNDVADKVAAMGRKAKKGSATDVDGGRIPVDPLVDGDATVPALAGPSGTKTLQAPPISVVPIKDGVTRLPEHSNGFGGGGAVPAAAPVAQAPMFRGKSAEEKQREELYSMEHQAMFASTAASKGSAGGSMLEKATGSSANPLSTLLAGLGAAGLGGVGGQQGATQPGNGMQQDDPNMQGQKEEFLTKAESRVPKPVLIGTRTKGMSAYEIQNGWDIPAVLEQGINTDLPGQIKALVRENVYDTATGRYLLIPQGSRVVGTYDSHVAYGQSRVQVVWDELIFPDGTTMKLAGMMGQDAAGASGFSDKVNRHYARMFGMALVTSAFSAGIQLSQGNSTTAANGAQSNSSIATQALGQQLGQLGMEIARKNMNVQPTITVPIGYRFNIRVNRDVAFAEPYAPMGR